jgi:uncharacterized protein YdcH (DUF465 family)
MTTFTHLMKGIDNLVTVIDNLDVEVHNLMKGINNLDDEVVNLGKDIDNLDDEVVNLMKGIVNLDDEVHLPSFRTRSEAVSIHRVGSRFAPTRNRGHNSTRPLDSIRTRSRGLTLLGWLDQRYSAGPATIPAHPGFRTV